MPSNPSLGRQILQPSGPRLSPSPSITRLSVFLSPALPLLTLLISLPQSSARSPFLPSLSLSRLPLAPASFLYSLSLSLFLLARMSALICSCLLWCRIFRFSHFYLLNYTRLHVGLHISSARVA